MSELVFNRQIDVPKDTVYRWHTTEGAFERLIPPWQEVRLLEAAPSIDEGTRTVIEIKHGLIRHRWVAEHFKVEEGNSFTDRQVSGPFKEWIHEHQFLGKNGRSTQLVDRLNFTIPGGLAGKMLMESCIEKSITNAFWFRHERTKMDLERLLGDRVFRSGLTVLITGHRGLVGRELSALLRSLGYGVRGLSRNPQGKDEFAWNPLSGEIDERAFDGVCAVVHLAGENVASGRWPASRREAILESRRKGTALIAATMARVCSRKTVLVSASGVNAYPSDGQPYDEAGPAGDHFLSEVCRAWERATEPASDVGLRVVKLRIGVVLSPRGGALGKMLLPFKLGLGGRLGTGNQMFSWIAIDDLTEIIVRSIEEESMAGVYNATAPRVVSQNAFAQVLATVLSRPAMMPVPASILQIVLGKDLANETLLADLQVIPLRLKDQGYRWRFPQLEPALRFMLGIPVVNQ